MKPILHSCRMFWVAMWCGWAGLVCGREPIRLAAVPALSPDGRALVFTWDGDLWRASADGGRATPLTRHPAADHWASFSPDGSQIAFQSMRTGDRQIFVMPAKGGAPRQVTAHSEGFTPLEWFPDGESILATAWRDYGGLIGQRMLRVEMDGSGREREVLDAYGDHGTVSPDGTRLLFTRDGVELYRKGYQGSLASQLWMHDFETGALEQPVSDPGGCRSPMWRPDGRGFYYVSARSGCFNIWEHDLESGEDTQHTSYTEDAVILPRISRDGSTLVFRNLFDFYVYRPGTGEPPHQIKLWHNTDRSRLTVKRRWYEKVWNNDEWGSLDWSQDGLEMVFTTGGNTYVMDTVLREPQLVAGDTDSHELEAVFTPDGKQVLMLRDTGDRVAIVRATRADPSQYWWENHDFVLETLNNEPTSKVNLTVSPDGASIAYVQNACDLYLADPDGGNPRLLYHAIDLPYYEWSPDSRWLACSLKDSFDNWDVWILSADGTVPPFNVSRHPNYDGGATWSPDGRMLAFIGEREISKELDLFYLYLRQEDHDALARDRTREDAAEKMRKERKEEDAPSQRSDADAPVSDDDNEAPPDDAVPPGEPVAPEAGEAELPDANEEAGEDDGVEVRIDFDGLSDRVRRIKISGSREASPFWSFDSKALAFNSTIKGRKGTYKVVFPDSLKPEFMTERTGSHARWIKNGSKILWLSDGFPYAYTEKYPFKVYQETGLVDYRRLGFRLIWRALKDSFYDDGFNGLDWDAVRRKYERAAATAPDSAGFGRVVSMLLGELNASHTGFRLTEDHWEPWRVPQNWTVRTAHLGVRFDPAHGGPGWRVRDVIRHGPADRVQSRLLPGDVITRIDGEEIVSGVARARYLSGLLERTLRLSVTGEDGTEREVLLTPLDYTKTRALLWEQWIEDNQRRVDEQSGGTLAYLHVDKMNWDTFYRFEQEIFSLGYGKDGLVIDVRNNEGGFTADHLLTILCRPRSAITIPRGGVQSYPRGYLSHMSWDKPIVVLCNQYTASNGEIFSHAIKALGRGKLIGVPTQGSVISTPSKKILDLGTLSLPRRGWFTQADGEDMEGHGAVPDIVIWPRPGDIPAGRDEQLDVATATLLEDVAAYQQRPRPPLRYARERESSVEEP